MNKIELEDITYRTGPRYNDIDPKGLVRVLNKLVDCVNHPLYTVNLTPQDGVGGNVNADLEEYKLKVKKTLEEFYPSTTKSTKEIIIMIACRLEIDLDVK